MFWDWDWVLLGFLGKLLVSVVIVAIAALGSLEDVGSIDSDVIFRVLFRNF